MGEYAVVNGIYAPLPAVHNEARDADVMLGAYVISHPLSPSPLTRTISLLLDVTI